MRWHEIQGWFDFQDIYDEAVAGAADGGVFVEIGCWRGCSTAYLAERLNESGKDQIRLYCIDNWLGEDTPGAREYVKSQGNVYAQFESNMKACGVWDRLTVLKGDSPEMSQYFEDGAVDFCFIDGDHRYEGLKRDLIAWMPKMKATGLLAGHDLSNCFPGIERAVSEILKDSWHRCSKNSWRRLIQSDNRPQSPHYL